MTLKKYQEKRDFKKTTEPAGSNEPDRKKETHSFVVQKHRATSLHYDFRLEHQRVLLSWAVPKGPSTDPSVKRLAMHVEDHPLDYANFEGVIPEGEYGGGTVMVWDNGTWTPEVPDIDKALKGGDLKFTLQGKKLRGSWVLVRTRGFGGSSKESWLLIKHQDEFASPADITAELPLSVLSGRLLADIAHDGGGDVKKAATGDPAGDYDKAKKELAAKSSKTTTNRSAKQAKAKSKGSAKKK